MDQDNKDKGGIVLNVYSPGNQFIHSQTNNYYGTVYQGGARQKEEGFTDEHIRQALMACVGKDRCPIDVQWKWVGAYWYLRWSCNYPVDIQKFCDKINGLLIEGDKWEVECKYDSVRKYSTLSFISEDATKIENVRYSKSDEQIFLICREIVLKLAENLGKSYLSIG